MDAKTYFKVSGINMAFLLAGLLIWPAAVNSRRYILGVVHAQTKEPALDPNVDYVTQSTGASGPFVTSMILTNRIACDRLEVNGFEVLKLNDAILSLLKTKGIASDADIQRIVNLGKAERPLRLKPAR
jgi:hypothetical protein